MLLDSHQLFANTYSQIMSPSISNKQIRRISRKERAAKQGDSVPDQPPADGAGCEIATRIFLYLQPKNIVFPVDSKSQVSVEIELEHARNVITKLSDHYTTQNIIYLDEFDVEKPTFSITMHQDEIEDVNNCFLTLTLYEIISKPFWKDTHRHGVSPVDYEENYEESSIDIEEEEELIILERRPVAQGYIDLLEFFTKTRIRSMATIFLYPLPLSSNHMSCKMEWEIYSLHPLVKQLNFSNALFITFTSLYNVEEHFLNDGEDLVASLSLISTVANENMEYHKIPICSFSAFSKQTIDDQIIELKWEILKNRNHGNEQSMAIMTGSKINVQQLFSDLLSTENVDLNTAGIDTSSDFALICNSMHRYILSDHMEKSLEYALAFNQYRIIVEICREREPSVVVLQGFIDLSVFMYPNGESVIDKVGY